MPDLDATLMTGDVDAVAELARAAAGPQVEEADPDNRNLLLVREAGGDGRDGVRVLDLEAYAKRPRRRKGEVRFDQPGSLEAYTNEFKVEPETRLYADLESGLVVVVFNDDVPGYVTETGVAPGSWRDHRASMKLKRTPEWDAWRQLDREIQSQVEFAEHVEEHLGSIVTPPAADLLEIVRTFTGSTKIAFRSAVNLANGEIRMAYDEDMDVSAAGTRQLDVPATFTLRLAPFQGCDPVDVTARLRYRMKDGHLRIGYILDKPDELEQATFQAEVSKVALNAGLEVHYGTPAPAR